MVDSPQHESEPDILYHYTDAGGSVGIAERSRLWATDIRFLNDPGELKYAWTELLAALQTSATDKPNYSEAYTAAQEAIVMTDAVDPDAIEDRIFSTSFSKHGDDLNQWRLYGNNGKGMSLGFETEQIRTLDVPYYHHMANGQLTPIKATVGNTGKQVDVTWAAFVQQVHYGEVARKKAVEIAIWRIEQHCGENGVGTKAQQIANATVLLPRLLADLALFKSESYNSEGEWRTTIAEHLGSSSSAIKRAFSKMSDYSWYAQGALQTVDVKFRPGGRAGFKPYTELPFKKSALVKVVIGPNTESPRLAVSIARRMLDRYGFRHTEVVPSVHEYRA